MRKIIQELILMVRIWSDIDVKKLNDKYLIAEHNELHVIWSALVKDKKGYTADQEVLRFKSLDGLAYLYNRHEEQVKEMKKRAINHGSLLKIGKAPVVKMVSHNTFKIPKAVLGNDLADLTERNGLIRYL